MQPNVRRDIATRTSEFKIFFLKTKKLMNSRYGDGDWHGCKLGNNNNNNNNNNSCHDN